VSCCPVVIALLQKQKGHHPVWMMALVEISPYVRLHHPLAVGKGMPTLIRSRASSRESSHTTGKVSRGERATVVKVDMT
jgi:hypothetical protein